jgi:hypothetical protein
MKYDYYIQDADRYTMRTIHHNFRQAVVGAVKERSHHVEGQAVAIAGEARETIHRCFFRALIQTKYLAI